METLLRGDATAQTLRAFYGHLSAGELEAAAGCLTDDTVLHVPGTGVNAGSYVGRDGVLGFVGAASAVTAGTLRLELQRAFGDDEWGVALATYTASRPDREVRLENHLAHVVRFRDGLIAESWLQARDQYAVDRFWSATP